MSRTERTRSIVGTSSLWLIRWPFIWIRPLSSEASFHGSSTMKEITWQKEPLVRTSCCSRKHLNDFTLGGAWDSTILPKWLVKCGRRFFLTENSDGKQPLIWMSAGSQVECPHSQHSVSFVILRRPSIHGQQMISSHRLWQSWWSNLESMTRNEHPGNFFHQAREENAFGSPKMQKS